MIRITCLGAVETVTGSNFLIETPGGKKYLVDCGLYQGRKQLEQRNWSNWGYDPRDIDSLLLTHAHIDHSGRIPKLVKDGFQGSILTTAPTRELCRIMLLDSAHIQETEAQWQSRKRARRGMHRVEPLYTTEDAEASLDRFTAVNRDAFIELDKDIKVRFRNAGHILGSSILEVHIGEDPAKEPLKIVFSGDLGKKDQLIVKDPHPIHEADYVFVESTYGNRTHRNFEESKQELLEAIRFSTDRGEKVFIPAFAVERSQEILYVLGELQREGLLPDIPVYLDSPLAIKATEIFRKNQAAYDSEAMAIVEQGFDPFDMPNLHFTLSTKESMAINEQSGPAIVIAGNGMGTAGRIKHHFKHNLWRDGSSVIIVGFQAAGSTGRRLVDGARQIKVFGEQIAVRSKISTIGGFSAHADQSDLLAWIGHFTSRPHVYLIHGEEQASRALGQVIEEQFGLSTHIPTWKEQLILKPPREVEEIQVAETGPELSIQALNALIDLEKELKTLKKQIEARGLAEELDEDDLERIQFLREEIQSMTSR